MDAYIATQRQRRSAVPLGAAEPANTPQQEMRAKVASPEGQEIYRRRSTTGACADTQLVLRATQPGKRSGWRQSPQPRQRPERARARARSWAGEERRALRATGS